MGDTYAKIQNGVVVNLQVCDSNDVFDANYIWIIVDNKTCVDGSPIQIGCLYDGSNFNTGG